MTATAARAQTVSRQLRTAGYNVAPSDRKYRHPGLYVTGLGDTVSVLVDVGAENHNQRLAAEVADALRGLGYTTSEFGSNDTPARFIHVTK